MHQREHSPADRRPGHLFSVVVRALLVALLRRGIREQAVDRNRDRVGVAERNEDPASILEAIVATDMQTIVGPVNWKAGPVKNVTKTPLAGGQWQRNNGKLELVVTTNVQHPEIPVGGTLKLLG